MELLDEYRKEIDSIDSEIIKLLEERFRICVKIGEYKKCNDIPILNQSREQEVIDKNIKKVIEENFKDYIQNVLISIMDESKKIQTKI